MTSHQKGGVQGCCKVIATDLCRHMLYMYTYSQPSSGLPAMNSREFAAMRQFVRRVGRRLEHYTQLAVYGLK